jgi:hypothetical protein
MFSLARSGPLRAVVAVIAGLFALSTEAALATDRDEIWHRAEALIESGDERAGIQQLERAYSLTSNSTELNPRKGLDEADILAEEIAPLRDLRDYRRLGCKLATFAHLANETLQRSSPAQPLKPSPAWFSAEEKRFAPGPGAGLSGDWLLIASERELIDKALRLAADGKYPSAIATLDNYRGDKPEFFWYYRAWIFAAENKRADSVRSFFLVLSSHIATPGGTFYSVEPDAAHHLSELPLSDLQ